jgi:hypothetical protein
VTPAQEIRAAALLALGGVLDRRELAGALVGARLGEEGPETLLLYATEDYIRHGGERDVPQSA